MNATRRSTPDSYGQPTHATYSADSPSHHQTRPDLGKHSRQALNPLGTSAYDPGRRPTRLSSRFQAFDVSGELCWVGSSTGDCGQPPAGATVYDYDDDGQRTGAGAESFAYDAYGVMTSASSGSSAYDYAADGLRTSKTVDGVTTPFAWDDSVGVPALVQDGVNYYIYGPDGLPVERLGTDPTVWLLTNETGSVAASIDTTGNSSRPGPMTRGGMRSRILVIRCRWVGSLSIRTHKPVCIICGTATTTPLPPNSPPQTPSKTKPTAATAMPPTTPSTAPTRAASSFVMYSESGARRVQTFCVRSVTDCKP